MYRNLYESKTASDIPVIMITGISPDFKNFIGARGKVGPPAAYFEKPVDRDELLKKVKELIG
jgi:hypothetical protein